MFGNAFEKNGFIIYGRVVCKDSGEPIEDLTVEALDKDLLFDDRLGSAQTDIDGYFEIAYNEDDFRELFFDSRPDIYLRIINPEGEIIYTTEDKVKYGAIKKENIDIKIPDDLIHNIHIVESQRIQFKQLIAVNPNYFGNVTDASLKSEYKPVSSISGSTKYEQLVCVGLQSDEDLLEAVIEVKLPYGFKGSLCSKGSTEYVAFYIDYGDGGGFTSIGAAATINVHDLAFVDGKHLFYAVRQGFIPKTYLNCDHPQIVKVRAILSWEKPPTGPSYAPVWGNVTDTWVQIKPKKKFWPWPLLKTEFFPIELPEQFVFIGDKYELKALVDKSIEAEQNIKIAGKVEADRIEFKQLVTTNPNYFGSICTSSDKDEVLKAIHLLPRDTLKSLLPKLIINPELFKPIKIIAYNTTYEQLKCVGFNPENDLMEAVVEVKLPYGFNGDLCTLGSQEYVTFYIDWGAGYQYAATAQVGVHDIPVVADRHLFYAVKATIPNIEKKLKSCKTENIVKLKAILSWNQDPTPFGPAYVPPWGNMLERYIQIRPKDGESTKCVIETVNDVHVAEISQSGANEGLAVKIDALGHAVPFTFDRPFGGVIACTCGGKINSSATYYRFRYSDNDGASWKNITDTRTARNPLPWWVTRIRTPDADGWFSAQEFNEDMDNYSLTHMVHWNSGSKNGQYRLRLELANSLYTVEQTSEVSIMLDNIGPELFAFGGTPVPLPSTGIVVKDAGDTYRKCGKFFGSDEIRIYGNFSDDYFLQYSLKVFGGNITASGVVFGGHPVASGVTRYDSGASGINVEGIIGAGTGSLGQKIETLNLCNISQSPDKVSCAYGIELTVWDRSIVGYVSGYEFYKTCHGIEAFVTFDWDPSGC
ncbi:transthyretin-like family protein [Methylobacter psychrophilus]|uniref:transthyretin-like family protein n=1 Tax=Methylobacter psychrophilus TaxID=96941 RepID=UPI0021D4B169|nr:transthyretin-like family protein [Methylobacter psychrophilus]